MSSYPGDGTLGKSEWRNPRPCRLVNTYGNGLLDPADSRSGICIEYNTAAAAC